MAQTHLVKACTWLSKEFNVSYREGHETLDCIVLVNLCMAKLTVKGSADTIHVMKLYKCDNKRYSPS